jgi:hypothetical protein
MDGHRGGFGDFGSMMQGMDQMMGGMMARHNQVFAQMDQMMGSAFNDPFFGGGAGRRGGGVMMPGLLTDGGRTGDRGERGGARERRDVRGGELGLFGDGGGDMMMGGMMGGMGGNGAMFMQSSVMTSDGSGNVYRRSQQHRQMGDVSESKFHEADSREQRETIGLRRGLGDRSRAVRRTRHASGDEEVHNVLNGVGEVDASAFDREWQGRAYGSAGAHGGASLMDRGSSRQQREPAALQQAPRHRQGRRESVRQPIEYGGGQSERHRRDIAPQGDMFGAYGAAARGGGGGGGGGGVGRIDVRSRGPRRAPAPSHRLMPPQAD